MIVSDTPRTIKRFVNIYRIIRSHGDLNYRTVEEQKFEDLLKVMFILGMVVGKYKYRAARLFKQCNSRSRDKIAVLLGADEETKPIVKMLDDHEILRPLLEVRGEDMTHYIAFVSRFSFNDYL